MSLICLEKSRYGFGESAARNICARLDPFGQIPTQSAKPSWLFGEGNSLDLDSRLGIRPLPNCGFPTQGLQQVWTVCFVVDKGDKKINGFTCCCCFVLCRTDGCVILLGNFSWCIHCIAFHGICKVCFHCVCFAWEISLRINLACLNAAF